MAEARDRAAWNRTMAVLAQLYNANRGQDARPIDPMQFFHWQAPRPKMAPPPTPEQREWLRANFGKKRAAR